MATKISYTSREYSNIVDEIRAQFMAELPGYNDFLDSNIGRWWIETPAAIADMISFNIDRQAAECFVDTVETRENMVGMLRLIGFQPMNPIPEQTAVTFSIAEAATTDVSIDRYTRLSDSNGRSWVTMYSATIPTGSTSVDVICMQGDWKTLTFTSTGTAFQKFLLNSTGIAEGKIIVKVNGIEWTQTDNNSFVGKEYSDEVYRYINTRQKKVVIEFGDGVEGKIPIAGYQIAIQFFVTDHINGKVLPGEISQAVSEPDGSDFDLNVKPKFTVRNSASSSGGADFESIDSAKNRYPQAYTTARRAVTIEDWTNLALTVPGVLTAKAADYTVDTTVPVYTVYVYVIGNGGSIGDASLEESVSDYFVTRKIPAIRHVVTGPQQKQIKVSTTIHVYRKYSPSEVTASVNKAIQDFFIISPSSDSYVDIGKRIFLTDLLVKILEVTGVATATLTVSTLDNNANETPITTDYLEVEFNEIARLNSVSVTFPANGLV
jgi:hypothetical protein